LLLAAAPSKRQLLLLLRVLSSTRRAAAPFSASTSCFCFTFLLLLLHSSSMDDPSAFGSAPSLASIGRGVSAGGGQISLGYLFGSGEPGNNSQPTRSQEKAPTNEPASKPAAASSPNDHHLANQNSPRRSSSSCPNDYRLLHRPNNHNNFHNYMHTHGGKVKQSG
uniref:Uncharacterized protein LOC104226758 n=1 Tax=Nicotiana sylvestris TaxID=4096 RepID=A0A1U7WIM8_NICSY